MDEIKVGLDFGTHQTKICIQRTPDEGHGEPNYEFFHFNDLQGNSQYFLPSVIQINNDDTLSYGFVDENRIKPEADLPPKPQIELEEEYDTHELAKKLYDKYASAQNTFDDIDVIENMLQLRLQSIKERNDKKKEESERQYEAQIRAHQEVQNIFRYFKQATFIGGEWNRSTSISNRILCIWYLAYVLFLLEEKFGTNFSINMGVPTDETSYAAKKSLAVEILASAYYLVEDVYHNDINSFLKEKVDNLLEKTITKQYSKDLKEEYWINIFPEAYASLIALTSRGKLPTGMSLTADIGGGTTDISFFTIENGVPMIYKYWSIPRGLNYIAEQSGFDYSEGGFTKRVHQDIIDKFNRKKHEIVYNLVKDLRKKLLNETAIPLLNLTKALENRILVYSGGGSTYPFLTKAINTFTDIRVLDASIWKEENIKSKDDVSVLSPILTTAYGLSVSKNDEEVILKNYSSLFNGLHYTKNDTIIEEVTKDQC